MSYDNIPPELRELKAWLVWKYERAPGDPPDKKPRKVPYYVSGGRRYGGQGGAVDRGKLATMSEAVAAAGRLKASGIGFAMMPEWEFTGLDFDDCVNSRGEVLREVRDIIGMTYCELSPSGAGVRAIVRGKLPNKKSRTKEWGWGFEAFGSSGFITMTGTMPAYRKAHIELIGMPGIMGISEAVTEIYDKRFGAGAHLNRLDGDLAAGDESTDPFLDLMFSAEPLGLSVRALEELVRELDPACGQEDWLKVLSAVHHETGGDPAGAALCAEWSAGKWSGAVVGTGGKVTAPSNFLSEHDVTMRYNSLRRKSGAGGKLVTARWLIWAVNKKKRERLVVLNPKDHTATALKIIESEFMSETGASLIRNNGLWFHYNDGVYEGADDGGDEAMNAKVHRFLDKAVKTSEKGLIPFHPNRNSVGDTVAALKAATLQDRLRPPQWLQGWEGPNAADTINLMNGLFHIPSRTLHGHNSGFFTLNRMDFGWEAGHTAPRWQEFLNDVWHDDPESIDTLQEMMGYLLTQDTRQQKMFLIYGPKRTGKGTIGRIIRALIGKYNCVDTSFQQLCSQFGLEALIGKQVAIMPDERNSRSKSGFQNTQVAISRLLSITGEDEPSVERKYKSDWTGGLKTRFLIMTNEIPNLGDSSEVFASRFIILKTDKSAYGKEDTRLTEKLMAELPGIFAWALDGLDRLNKRGRFIQPQSAVRVFEEMVEANNPVRRFIKECTRPVKGAEVTREELYNRYSGWCGDEGINCWSRNVFLKVAKEVLGEDIIEKKTTRNYREVRIFVGLKLIDLINFESSGNNISIFEV